MQLRQLAPWNWFHKEKHESNASQKLNAPTTTSPTYLDSMLSREFDKLATSLFQHLGNPQPFNNDQWQNLTPQLDIKETKKHYEISLEIPGVEKEDLNIHLSDDSLIIEGKKKQSIEDDKDNYHYIGRHYGHFQRILALPSDANQEQLKANFKNGVLTITISKTKNEESNKKSIQIN